jgi:hypothetical protein
MCRFRKQEWPVATLPETRKIKFLNMCINGQTPEAHGKKSYVSSMCQVKIEPEYQ